MKVSTSCIQCRIGKRKCTVEHPGLPCQHCLKLKKHCSFKRSLQRPPDLLPCAPREKSIVSPPVSCLRTTTAVSDPQLEVKLVDLYLTLIHDKPHTLFHPESMRRRCQNGELPKAVIYSIMALAARFSDNQEVRKQAKELFQLAKLSLKMEIENVNLDTIHASILVGNLCGAEGETAGEALFFGIAFRMAHFLHLPKPDPTDDAITQEIKVRTWWSLYMIDTWSSAGLNLPRQIHDKGCNRLPMSERRFWNLEAGQKVESDTRFGIGLWGYMVMLARIFSQVQDLHVKLADGELNESQVEDITRELADQLDRFLEELPSDLNFTRDNLKSHAAAGLGRGFVALHLGYHHYATLLYFQYLDIQLGKTASGTLFVARCKHHAASFSDILRISHEIEECEVVYLIVAHMTVVSSSALLHTLLFGSQDELQDTRKRLCFNFELLLKLKQYWSGVELMMSRLFTFQKACMQSMDSIYTADRWIVKFLLHHALPIDEGVEIPTGSNLAEREQYARDALSMLGPLM
ncbi:unnamed protein product [Penicillium salamii]|nr:unnamed protein product [Penicillium salamii]CAG8295977.1 unnamed protein product [Penicillium salamii]CAG8400900.1 unnamed protein product [Penicillium salamii]